MRKSFKLYGFILKKKKLRDKDLQIVLFSKEKGKITIFAKGVQKITSRRLSHLDTGNLVEVLVYFHKDAFYAKETSLISGFSSIKEDLKKSLNFFYVLKVVEKFSPEGEKDDRVFKLLIDTIKKINHNKFKKEEFVESLSQILGIEKKEILKMVQ